MPTADALRRQIESSLNARVPAALSSRLRSEPVRLACGIPALDELLHGGLPTAVVSEFVGAEGSGRTTLALAYAAALTHAGGVCAWIDVADALDPETVAANGVDLDRLLWVRCGGQQTSATQSGIEAVPSVGIRNGAEATAPRHTGGGSPHPRSEGRGMPEAILAMLNQHGGLYDHQARRERKGIGTPGMPNRPLANRSPHREEQPDSDRLPARRGENLVLAPRCAEPQQRRVLTLPSAERISVAPQPRKASSASTRTPWQALGQALRATDLLLQNGGFGALVLDLGSTPAEAAWRIPQATWFRFRSACERTRASLLLLTQHPCAGSSAELVLRLEPGTLAAENKVLTGICYGAAIERTRSPQPPSSVVPIRKPPQSIRPGQWKSEAAWAR